MTRRPTRSSPPKPSSVKLVGSGTTAKKPSEGPEVPATVVEKPLQVAAVVAASGVITRRNVPFEFRVFRIDVNAEPVNVKE